MQQFSMGSFYYIFGKWDEGEGSQDTRGWPRLLRHTPSPGVPSWLGKPFKVLDGLAQPLDIILEVPKPLIAIDTQHATQLASGVAMV